MDLLVVIVVPAVVSSVVIDVDFSAAVVGSAVVVFRPAVVVALAVVIDGPAVF